MLRKVLKQVREPEVVYRAASHSVARHYGLRGLGAIAPGYRADIVRLGDVMTCGVRETYVAGVPATELVTRGKATPDTSNSVRTTVPEAAALESVRGNVHVIDVIPGKIITGRGVAKHDAPGVHRLTVLERHGHGRAPANAYVRGFGDAFHGAIGSSVGHDSHNLIVAGNSESDMAVAVNHLIDLQGGAVVVRDGRVLADLPLPPFADMRARLPLSSSWRPC